MRGLLAIISMLIGGATLFTVPLIGVPAFAVAFWAASGKQDDGALMGWIFLLAVAGIVLGLVFGGLPVLDP